jgi:hypothetical protein
MEAFFRQKLSEEIQETKNWQSAGFFSREEIKM